MEIVSKREPENESIPTLEDSNDVDYPIEGELLVAKRVLNVQANEDELKRENIFHTQCLVNRKVCILIIY